MLVAPAEGRKDAETHRMSGRARDNRLVHFAVPEGAERPRPGDMVTVDVTYGAPHHLVADSAIQSIRRTRAGDAWERRTSAPPAASAVGLGMPSVGVPAPLPPAANACG